MLKAGGRTQFNFGKSQLQQTFTNNLDQINFKQTQT